MQTLQSLEYCDIKLEIAGLHILPHTLADKCNIIINSDMHHTGVEKSDVCFDSF